MNKQQLANRIWNAANKMRSKIDANEYKDYILGLIFYKFLSDTQVKYLHELGWTDDDIRESLVEDEADPDMKSLIDRCRETIGFFIEYQYLFSTWLNDNTFSVGTLSAALRSFDRLMGERYSHVYKDIFKTLSEGLSKLGDNPSAQTKALKELISLIRDIPTDGQQDYDVLGYVYEFLISNFAASAGKKAGEFYTPHEVAKVMSEIVADHHKNKQELAIYDPTSGSGSLLITIGKAVSKYIHRHDSIKYYAQELKENTYNLTRMNLVMRGIIPANINTRCADTLEEDWPQVSPDSDYSDPLAVDAVVSNPPYSQHWDVKDKDLDERFAPYGVAPKTKADYAFLLHELYHLKPDGIMTIVLPHGVLFRGGSEGEIRRNLIEKNNIDAVIGLPANIFFGTGIPTLIMVLRKNRGDEGVLVIDASKDFVKDGKQNRLRACDIRKIADTYRLRLSIPGYSREVTREEIRNNEYNLNIPRYVDSSETAERYDIYATMFGGIPNVEIAQLQKYWAVFPSLQQELFAADPAKPYSTLKTADVAATIHANKDVELFKAAFREAFSSLPSLMRTRLIDNVDTVKDVEECDNIATDIFRRTEPLPLVDKYAAYQILADHWEQIMGDVEVIQSEGYGACKVVDEKQLVPSELVQRMFLADELTALTSLQTAQEEKQGQLDSIMEALDEEAKDVLLNDDGTKWDYASFLNDTIADCGFSGNKAKKEQQFLRQQFDDDTPEAVLQQVLPLQADIKKLSADIKVAAKQLDEHTVATIGALDMKQIGQLLEAKWIAPVIDGICAMPDTIIARLADAIRALNDKYATSYSDIQTELSAAQQDLAQLVCQLTGDEFAINGLKNLVKGE